MDESECTPTNMRHVCVVDIPELASVVASWLSSHDLTVCVRVNKRWSEGFLPFLYQDIKVYDFDLFSHRSCRAPRHPLFDLWSLGRDPQNVSASRLTEMNMLDFNLFQQEQDNAIDQSQQEVQQQSGHSSHKGGLNKETSAVSSLEDTANAPKKSTESKSVDTDNDKDLPQSKLLFPNLKLSPLSLEMDMTPPIGSFSRALEQYRRPVGYGGQFVHKYGRFIQTLTVSQPQSLRYLGPHCRNLRELSVYEWCTIDPEFRNGDLPPFVTVPNRIQWELFRVSRDQSRILHIWIGLLERNPLLRIVRFELNLVPVGGLAKFALALSKLKYLEEIEVFDANMDRRIDVLLDHCPNVPKFIWSSAGDRAKTSIRRRDKGMSRHSRSPALGRNQVGKAAGGKLKGEELGGNGRLTRIQTLDLRNLPRTVYEMDIHRVLVRMPQLKCLWIPVRRQTRRRLALVMQGILPQTKSKIDCSLLTRLEITLDRSSFHMFSRPLEQLLNACPNLTSLSLYNMLCELDPAMHFVETGLGDQILEYEERTPSACQVTRGTQLSVTKWFPNLRILNLGTRPVHLVEFFSMQWNCKNTLVELTLSLCCDQGDAQAYKRTFATAAAAATTTVAVSVSPLLSSTDDDISSTSSSTQPIHTDGRAVLQRHIFDSLLPLVRLEKLCLPKGLWNEKTTSFPFVIDPETIIQIQRLRWLKELRVHNALYPLH